MDDLNKRVLSVMEAMKMSKSAFALELDVSLPVLTHIGSGRNKPGLELIQKLLTRFEEISPDWLLLGKGEMYRIKVETVNLATEIQRIKTLLEALPTIARNTQQVQDYHKILLKEIAYLNDLQPYLSNIGNDSVRIGQEIGEMLENMESKLKNK